MKRYAFYLSLLFFMLILSCKKNTDVDPQSGIPKVKTFPVANINRYYVDVSGQVTDSGEASISAAGFVVGTVATPTIESNLNKFIVPIEADGNLKVTIIEIPAGSTYYIRAFATNKYGTGYGDEVSFSLPKAGKVYQGDVTLSTQQEIIDFGAEQYTTIDGALIITGSVTDLSPLKHLAIINYALKVSNTVALKNLKGMDSLAVTNAKYFFHGMRIENNIALTSLEGLEKLKSNNGDLYIINNDALTDLRGLNNISYSHFGELRVDNCDNIRSLNGLEKLEWLDGSVMLKDNPTLTDISALRNLSFVNYRIQIYNNASLQNLDGLEKLHKLEGVELVDNLVLADIKGLRNLDTISDIILLQNNGVLNNLSPFDKINTVEYLTIENSPALTSLAAFHNLVSVPGAITLDNTGLTDLTGLEGLTKATRLNIYFNENLVSLQGLNNITSIRGNSYPFTISRNNKLKTLAGLEHLTDVECMPTIAFNPLLSEFCPLRALFATGWNGDFMVEGNAINPNGQDILRDCKP